MPATASARHHYGDCSTCSAAPAATHCATNANLGSWWRGLLVCAIDGTTPTVPANPRILARGHVQRVRSEIGQLLREFRPAGNQPDALEFALVPITQLAMAQPEHGPAVRGSVMVVGGPVQRSGHTEMDQQRGRSADRHDQPFPWSRGVPNRRPDTRSRNRFAGMPRSIPESVTSTVRTVRPTRVPRRRAGNASTSGSSGMTRSSPSAQAGRAEAWRGEDRW